MKRWMHLTQNTDETYFEPGVGYFEICHDLAGFTPR